MVSWAPLMGGYIRLDKDLRDDPRVVALAEVLTDVLVDRVAMSAENLLKDPGSLVTLRRVTRDALSVSHVTLVLGSLASLWMYADTYLKRGDHLNMPLDKLASVCGTPVELLQHFPPEWLQSDGRGLATLPGYIEKNSLDSRDVRRAKTRARTKRYRERLAAAKCVGEKQTPTTSSPGKHCDARDALVTHPRAGAPARASRSPSPTHTKNQNQESEHAYEAQIGDAQSAHENFEILKGIYPPFSGRQDWISAEHHAQQRIETDGLTWAELRRSVERYAIYCLAGGVSGPQYVMTPAKFFSAADRPWQQGWTPPPNKGEVRRDTNIKAGLDWLAQQDAKHEHK